MLLFCHILSPSRLPQYSFLPHFRGVVFFFFLSGRKGPGEHTCDLPQSLDPWRDGAARCPSDSKHFSVQPIWIWLQVALEERWKWTLKYIYFHNSPMKWRNYCHLHFMRRLMSWNLRDFLQVVQLKAIPSSVALAPKSLLFLPCFLLKELNEAC